MLQLDSATAAAGSHFRFRPLDTSNPTAVTNDGSAHYESRKSDNRSSQTQESRPSQSSRTGNDEQCAAPMGCHESVHQPGNLSISSQEQQPLCSENTRKPYYEAFVVDRLVSQYQVLSSDISHLHSSLHRVVTNLPSTYAGQLAQFARDVSQTVAELSQRIEPTMAQQFITSVNQQVASLNSVGQDYSLAAIHLPVLEPPGIVVPSPHRSLQGTAVAKSDSPHENGEAKQPSKLQNSAFSVKRTSLKLCGINRKRPQMKSKQLDAELKLYRQFFEDNVQRLQKKLKNRG